MATLTATSMATVEETLTQALQYHRAGQRERAEQAYRQILEEEADLADAWHLLGLLAHQHGDEYAAIGFIAHAIALDPVAAAFHSSLGAAFRALGRLDAAVHCYRQALQLKADDPEAHNNLGVALMHQGKLDEAVACCRRALELKPDYAEAQNDLGIALMEQGKPDEAAACYRRVLELEPDRPEAHHNLGIAALGQGNLDQAAAACRRAVDLKPEYAEAHKTLGDVLWRQRNPDQAMACYRRAFELKPDYADAHQCLGNVLWEQRKLDEAAACWRRALELNPHNPAAYNDLGNYFDQQGNPDEAIRCWRRALRLNPRFAMAYNNLGIALRERGKLAEAVACYRRALEIYPDYPEAHNNLATAMDRQGKREEAVGYWRRALELRPDFGPAYCNLAVTFYQMRRIDDAAATAEQWLRHVPEDAVARHLLAAYTGQGVPPRAADEYIRETFDHFARNFERHLRVLEYRAPDMIAAATAAAFGAPQAALEILDAGCGTGWCGPLLRPYARRLTGVDLSPSMLDRARDRQVYDQLIEGELTAHLQETVECYDLVTAADTLVYFGDLQPVLAAAAGALRPRGFLIFTVERASDEDSVGPGFSLQHHGRYCHTEGYVRSALQAAGLSVREMTFGILRREMDKPVQGILAAACREEG